MNNSPSPFPSVRGLICFLVCAFELGCHREVQTRTSVGGIGVYYPQSSFAAHASRLDQLARELGFNAAHAVQRNPECCIWIEPSAQASNRAVLWVSSWGVKCQTSPDLMDASCDAIVALLRSDALEKSAGLSFQVVISGGSQATNAMTKGAEELIESQAR